MKKKYLAATGWLIFMGCTPFFSSAQSNTYPWVSSGDIGIGTSSPATKLEVTNYVRFIGPSSSGAPSTGEGLEFTYDPTGHNGYMVTYDRSASAFKGLIVNASPLTLNANSGGNVGIGTASPTSGKLHIVSAADLVPIYAAGETTNGEFLAATKSNGSYAVHFYTSGTNTATDPILRIGNAAGTDVLSLLYNGNVGIGTSTPADQLSVNGRIRSKEIKVEITGWPDYVFAPAYRPASLPEVERFIRLNQHLPGIPSADEIKQNGADLGDMNSRLLKKIEELTLYMIEKDKQVAAANARIDELSKRLDQVAGTKK